MERNFQSDGFEQIRPVSPGVHAESPTPRPGEPSASFSSGDVT